MEDEKEHHEHVNNSYKRSQQKQNEEIADLKVNLEQIQSRNTDLERKQKRFDQVKHYLFITAYANVTWNYKYQ